MTRGSKTEEVTLNSLKIEYEPEVDILTVYFHPPATPLKSSNERDGTVLNYGTDGKLVSIEIMDASGRYPHSQLAALSVDELIDLKEAARLASIAPVTLRTQAEKGRLWALRLGGQWVTSRDRLQQYLETRSRKRPTHRTKDLLRPG